MSKSRNLPNPERLSVLIATILLAYALAQFVDAPSRLLPLQIIGVFIPIQLNLNMLVAIAVAGMTATGTDWLLRDHPRLGNNSTLPHWLLPGLTALILSVLLSSLKVTPLWWVVFSGGAMFLVLVLIAEYIVVDSDDLRQPLASGGLNALAYVVFLILAVSLRSTELRLLMSLPALALAAGLVSLRATHLRLQAGWLVPHSLTTMLIVAQLAAALHYLPVSPTAFGLLLLGPTYALPTFIQNLEGGTGARRAMVEPVITLAIVWSLALWIG